MASCGRVQKGTISLLLDTEYTLRLLLYLLCCVLVLYIRLSYACMCFAGLGLWVWASFLSALPGRPRGRMCCRQQQCRTHCLQQQQQQHALAAAASSLAAALRACGAVGLGCLQRMHGTGWTGQVDVAGRMCSSLAATAAAPDAAVLACICVSVCVRCGYALAAAGAELPRCMPAQTQKMRKVSAAVWCERAAECLPHQVELHAVHGLCLLD